MKLLAVILFILPALLTIDARPMKHLKTKGRQFGELSYDWDKCEHHDHCNHCMDKCKPKINQLAKTECEEKCQEKFPFTKLTGG